MAFTRHQIEKRRLIELVRVNPILWDCRLPHYKRSDKKKALKWNELGRIFSVNGERVQRTFTSLREIFRRELNHEKMLGSRFKSKWEYYDEMAFLKEVIRERKSRERAKSNDAIPLGLNNSNSNNNNTSTGIDEYQYFAPNDINNPHNQAAVVTPTQPQMLPQPLQLTLQQTTSQTPIVQSLLQSQSHTGCTTPQLPNNPPNTPVTPLSTASGMTQIQPDVLLSLNSSTLAALQKLNASALNANGAQQLPLQPGRPISRARSLTIRSCSSSPSIYIKDEPDSLDDTISLDTTSNGHMHKNKNANDYAGKRKYTKHGKLSTMALQNKTLNNSTQNLVIDERDCSDLDDDPDVDMLDDDRLSIASSLQSLNKDLLDDDNGRQLATERNPNSNQQQQQQAHQQTNPFYLKPTAREILYTKFGEFLAARLNTLNETVANELMNKILMLIAEK